MEEDKKPSILNRSKILKVDVAKIKVKDRLRKDLGDLRELKESLKTYGQMNPILVDEEYVLIAGERRYEALKSLGVKEIEVRIVSDLEEYDRLSLEIQENFARKDFTTGERSEALGQKRLLEIKKRSLFRYYWEKIKRFLGFAKRKL